MSTLEQKYNYALAEIARLIDNQRDCNDLARQVADAKGEAQDARDELEQARIGYSETVNELTREVVGLERSVEELTEAIRFTVEYVGNDTLPAKEGWSWYDALKKYAPKKAKAFADNPVRFP